MRPRIQLLDDGLIERILDEARQILAEVGIEVRGPELRRRLLEAGLPASPDGRILFPPDVVDRAIATAPGHITLYDR
ncbi:MAG TPA: trimethylamine methyltransferase family protein, partial [Promineifilum sp.]